MIYNKLQINTGKETVPIELLDSTTINAWTDGNTITVTTSLMQFTDNDDEIAAVVAHEMSHVMLKHVTNPYDTVTNMESDADKMSVYLMLKAGYNPCNGRELWHKLANLGSGDYADTTNAEHPSYAFRYNSLTMPWCAK